MSIKFGALPVLAMLDPSSMVTTKTSPEILPKVRHYIEQRVGEFDKISDERKALLKSLTLYIQTCIRTNQQSRLTFICTHNSRRSHLSQIWAAVAAVYYRVPGVATYSGGTEATAFNPRAISAIKRAGLLIAQPTNDKNPHYEVRFQETDNPMICFSKLYNEAPNPNSDYCAVLTCTEADKNCPNVCGASKRIALPFEDPKVADDTPEEAATYDARCDQISREILYAFSLVEPGSPHGSLVKA